jgi:hypothetical protein
MIPYHYCASSEKAAFAGLTVSNISMVIKMADVKHQAQVAPMTKGSRKVR